MEPEELTGLWSATIIEVDLAGGDPGATYKPDAARTAPLERRGAAAVFEALRPQSFPLRGELGRGGMGVVHRAYQPVLDRDIALKTALSGAGERAFIEEALVTAELAHPNIVPVYDLVASGPDALSLAMKLVSGIEWRRLIRPRSDEQRARAAAMSLDDHLEILLKVCDAVAFAHSRGIAHCDLKPENVMVGDFGEVLVMDWGIALDIRDPATADGPLKASHCRSIQGPRGTPQYMAPELAEGRGQDIGPWTDVYLLGAILYELLSGRPPHAGATLAAVVMAAVLSAPPAIEGAPRELAAIASKALSREPRDRHASVAAFQSAIKDFQRRRESIAVADAALAVLEGCRGEAPSEAGRIRLYAGYAEAVAGLAQAQVLWAENPRAIAGEQKARAAYARAALAGGDLGLAEAQIARLERGSQEKSELRGELAAARRRLTLAARRTFLLKGGVGVLLTTTIASLALGIFYVDRERAAKEAESERAKASALREAASAARAKARAQELREALDIVVGEVVEKLEPLPYAGARAAREGILRRSLSFIEELEAGGGEAYSVQRGRGALQLARVYDALGDTVKAREQRRAAATMFEQVLKSAPKNSEAQEGLVAALLAQATDAYFHSRSKEARDLCRRAEALAGALCQAPEPPRSARRALMRSEMMLVALLVRGVELAAAREHHRPALELARALASEAPQDLTAQRELAACLSQGSILAIEEGRLDDALAIRVELVRRLRELRATWPSNTRLLKQLADAVLELGQLEASRGRVDQARVCFDQSLTMRREQVEKDPLNNDFVASLCRVLNELGGSYERSGDSAAADRCYEEGLAAARRLCRLEPEAVENRRFLAADLALVGQAALKRGAVERAAALGEEEAEQLRAALGLLDDARSRRDLAEALFRLAECYYRLQRKPQVIAVLAERLVQLRALIERCSKEERPQHEKSIALTEEALAQLRRP